MKLLLPTDCWLKTELVPGDQVMLKSAEGDVAFACRCGRRHVAKLAGQELDAFIHHRFQNQVSDR